MSNKKRESKFITKGILKESIIESFKKLNPKYIEVVHELSIY